MGYQVEVDADKCEGCERIVEEDGVKYCKTYVNPEAKWRLGICNFATHAKPEIKVVYDQTGSRLQVDGEDFFVFGMNWGYMPIGENYSYAFWDKPDEFIEAFIEWARGPYPGARSLLGRLHDSHVLACLSNSNELHTPLHRQSIEPLLDRYYFSDELALVKPEKEIFDYVIRDLGVAPRRIAFFDDTRINVRAARDVGIIAFEVDGIAELEMQLQLLGVFNPERAP